MPSRVTSGKHLGLINLRVGMGLAVAVDRVLRFPVLVEQELRVVGRGVIDLESGAARLLARVPGGLDQQAADCVDIGPILDRQNHVQIEHGGSRLVGWDHVRPSSVRAIANVTRASRARQRHEIATVCPAAHALR